jgi:DNA-binding Lrp family transcriptional regulator
MREIADRLNISEKSLYNYLSFLRSKDLVYDYSGNIVFRSIRTFLGRNKTIIYMDENFTLFDVSCCLYAKILEQKGKQIAFIESVRRAGNRDKFKREFSETGFRPSLSFRTIAKLLNCSEFKSVRIVQNLNRLQIIRTEKQKPQLISNDFHSLNLIEDFPGYRFNIRNKLFVQFGNLVEFLQFPVYLKRITIRQYKKYIINNL